MARRLICKKLYATSLNGATRTDIRGPWIDSGATDGGGGRGRGSLSCCTATLPRADWIAWTWTLRALARIHLACMRCRQRVSDMRIPASESASFGLVAWPSSASPVRVAAGPPRRGPHTICDCRAAKQWSTIRGTCRVRDTLTDPQPLPGHLPFLFAHRDSNLNIWTTHHQ